MRVGKGEFYPYEFVIIQASSPRFALQERIDRGSLCDGTPDEHRRIMALMAEKSVEVPRTYDLT